MYLDDTGSMLPVWLREGEGGGGSSMDAVFGVIIECRIERGEESSEIRGRKLIFEYLEIDFDMGENFE